MQKKLRKSHKCSNMISHMNGIKRVRGFPSRGMLKGIGSRTGEAAGGSGGYRVSGGFVLELRAAHSQQRSAWHWFVHCSSRGTPSSSPRPCLRPRCRTQRAFHPACRQIPGKGQFVSSLSSYPPCHHGQVRWIHPTWPGSDRCVTWINQQSSPDAPERQWG